MICFDHFLLKPNEPVYWLNSLLIGSENLRFVRKRTVLFDAFVPQKYAALCFMICVPSLFEGSNLGMTWLGMIWRRMRGYSSRLLSELKAAIQSMCADLPVRTRKQIKSLSTHLIRRRRLRLDRLTLFCRCKDDRRAASNRRA